MNEKLVKLLEKAEKVIATLMLEVNRLNDELELVKKELALQKLSDIGQAIEKPVGSNWWKGDPTCGGIAENYMSKETSDKC